MSTQRTPPGPDLGFHLALLVLLLLPAIDLEAQNYKHTSGYTKAQVNPIANFCFLTKDTTTEWCGRSTGPYYGVMAGKEE